MESNNWYELVRKHWPDVNDAEADILLWETTCYPFGTIDTISQQLQQSYEKYGGVQAALDGAYAELDDFMAKAEMMDALTRDYSI